MKNLYVYIFLTIITVFSTPLGAWGQTLSTDRNAVVHSKFRVATTNEADASDASKALINVQYMDGLGRPLQMVGYQQSPTQKDIISGATGYDRYGRNSLSVLPVPASGGTGNYQNSAVTLAQGFYGDTRPYSSVSLYERSVASREREIMGPGQAWQTNDKKSQVFDEIAGVDVRLYKLDGSNNIIKTGSYPANSLYKKRIIDEQGHTSIEIKDKQGRVVQKQTQDAAGESYITTYYIYDGLNRVRAVIQPEGYELNQSINYNTTQWNNWVFFYMYDNRSRVIEKKVPGAEAEWMVYDKWDRLVWQQTALQREQGKWTFLKYDSFNRPVMSGEKSESRNRVTLQTEANNWTGDRYESRVTGGDIYYSYSNTYPQIFNTADIRQVFYFDDYDNWRPNDMLFDGANAYHTQLSSNIGLATGGRSRNSENGNWLVSVNYFDNKQRIIQTFSHNLYGNIERTDYKYNFAGEAMEIRYLMRDTGNNATIQLERFDYDNAGRKTAYKLGMNAVGETIATYEYDEIGRLKTKKFYPDRQYAQVSELDYINRPPNPSANTEDIATKAIFLNPGTSIDAVDVTKYVASIGSGNSNGIVQGLQTINFGYHLRGMLNCVNCSNNQPSLEPNQNDFFANKLEFETSGWWDGNIGKQAWVNKKDNILRSYTHSYDPAKRLLTSIFGSANGTENYTLSIGGYDKNGNIQSLNRTGLIENNYSPIDQLSYSYNGNRLSKVEDAISGDHNGDFVNDNSGSDDYEYWTDGSLKKDLNKKITLITYDSYLNKVKQVDFANSKWLKLYYDGDGTLLKRLNSDNEQWEYTPKSIFKDGQLYQISQDEGRVVKVNSSFVPEFEYRDYQNNLRVSFRDTLASPVNGVYLAPIITQYEDRDPTGVLLAGLNYSKEPKNNRGFIDRESIKETGWIDLNNRFYMPELMRFGQTDPVIDEQENYSPYQYGWNNPVLRSDPNGDCPFCPWLDAVVDVGFVAYDAAVLIHEKITTGKTSAENWAALGADGVSILVPMSVGAGMAVKAMMKAAKKIDKAVDVVKTAEKVNDAEKVVDKVDDAVKATSPYKRPNNATTKAQRKSVQDKPCVDCGKKSDKMVADHKEPLVKEHYETGAIDKKKMRDIEAVQPQCPTCSAKQGAEMSKYSKEQKAKLNNEN